MPVLATYFSVRRGRDPFFKFFMRTIFPRQMREYEEKFGIQFLGWYNVAHGWDFDNVILMDLPDYATLDKLEADEAARLKSALTAAEQGRNTFANPKIRHIGLPLPVSASGYSRFSTF